MAGLELVLLLLAVSAGLRILAERLVLPYSALLVVGGLILAVTPNLPRVTLSPDVLFLIFVPPLLYWGAVSFPLRDFRRELGPILRLAVLMVLVSTTAVALLAHSIDPAFTWAAAFALGAIVSPPDPVAVLSLVHSPSLRIPRQIESILEGEGLLNDATALVTYRMAVAVAVTGAFSPLRAGWQFLSAAVGGLAIGLTVAIVITRLHRLTRSVPVAENTISLLTPFAAFLPADLVGASGVVATVAAGMYLARQLSAVSPETRLQNQSMWSVVTFLLESLVFILVGLELPYVTRSLGGYSITSLIGEAALVCVCVVVVRMLWVVPSTYIGRAIGAWIGRRPVQFPPWRWILFIGWAGVRGGDSLVIALALPLTTALGAPFPARAQIVFITFAVILLTLVLQGPTLAPIARWLGLHLDHRADGEEEAHARLSAAEAGLAVLASRELARSPYPEVARYLRQRHRQRARRWASREASQSAHVPNDAAHDHSVAAPSHEAGALDERRSAEYRRIRAAMIGAERQTLLDLRDRDVIGDDVMRRVQRDLDLEMILLDSREPVVDSGEDQLARDGGA